MFSAENADILLRGLRKLELEYDKLEIYTVHGSTTWDVRFMISACRKTLTHLKLGLCDCELHALNSVTSVV